MIFRFWVYCTALPSILLELPVTIVEWADLTGLEPARYAVEMEGVLKYHRQPLRPLI